MSIKKSVQNNTNLIKKIALELGFVDCKISKARFLKEEEKNYENWLKNGYQGKMSYLEKNFDKRLDPTKLVPGAKSVISLSYNYYPKKKMKSKSKFLISKYAYGKDYHFVIKKKLYVLLERLKEKIGQINGRVFVDSAPVHERAWAKQSGIGWIGKNSLILNKKYGSFFFLAEMITDLELVHDYPIKNYCGTCTRCIDNCPTNAIVKAQVINASKCISYLTIELKDEIPNEFNNKLNDWIFGCDICQDVCPWNKFSIFHDEKDFILNNEIEKLSDKDWIEMTEETFKKIFKASPLKRANYKGINKNLRAVLKNN